MIQRYYGIDMSTHTNYIRVQCQNNKLPDVFLCALFSQELCVEGLNYLVSRHHMRTINIVTKSFTHHEYSVEAEQSVSQECYAAQFTGPSRRRVIMHLLRHGSSADFPSSVSVTVTLSHQITILTKITSWRVQKA